MELVLFKPLLSHGGAVVAIPSKEPFILQEENYPNAKVGVILGISIIHIISLGSLLVLRLKKRGNLSYLQSFGFMKLKFVILSDGSNDYFHRPKGSKKMKLGMDSVLYKKDCANVNSVSINFSCSILIPRDKLKDGLRSKDPSDDVFNTVRKDILTVYSVSDNRKIERKRKSQSILFWLLIKVTGLDRKNDKMKLGLDSELNKKDCANVSCVSINYSRSFLISRDKLKDYLRNKIPVYDMLKAVNKYIFKIIYASDNRKIERKKKNQSVVVWLLNKFVGLDRKMIL